MWHFLTKNNELFYRKQRKLPRGLSVKAGMGNRRTEWGMGGMMGMPGIRLGMQGIGVRNEWESGWESSDRSGSDESELCSGINIKGNVHIHMVLSLSYKKQRN